MLKKKMLISLIIVVIFSMISFLYAKEFKVAVKQIPTTDAYISILKAIGEETGTNFDIQIVPANRADYLVESGQVDLQFPIIVPKNQAQIKELKYDFATVVLYKLGFVLFTNKNKVIDVKELKKGNPKKFKIEVDVSRVDDVNFPVSTSTNIETSLTKVDNGTIDGYIYGQSATDLILKKLGLKNIKRQLWEEFDLTFSLKKGTKGGELDKILTDGLNKMKANGKYDQLVGNMAKASKYDNWQP